MKLDSGRLFSHYTNWRQYPRRALDRPHMPWFQLRNILDDDLMAIWLHIKTIEPIRNEVPEHIIK